MLAALILMTDNSQELITTIYEMHSNIFTSMYSTCVLVTVNKNQVLK